MSVKYIMCLLIIVGSLGYSDAQTMRWIPFVKGLSTGGCPPIVIKSRDVQCFALEYTPAISGTLTSYTTGFFVTCTSKGSAVVKNYSCAMRNNTNLMNGCQDTELVLMNSSGNGGSLANNPVVKDVPVILHQVCFSIPEGESITVTEDEITDITTSIDVSGGVFMTEYPEVQPITIKSLLHDIAKPVVFVDFKTIPAGNFISQLDWSTKIMSGNEHYIIERALDGVNFKPIGQVDVAIKETDGSVYQFFDKNALEGRNDYRILQISATGEVQYSPVRSVTFGPQKFNVSFSPSPAKEYLSVSVNAAKSKSHIQLIDHTGRTVIEEIMDLPQFKSRFDISGLSAGIYTLVVISGDDDFTEKIVIVE